MFFHRPPGGVSGLFIVGAQKCGTTTLHKALARHRGLREAREVESGSSSKEVDFFSTHWERGLDWYMSLFPAGRGPILDSSTSYLCNLDAPERLARAHPDARIVVSLRDPVARAHSAYNHYSQTLDETSAWDWKCPGQSFKANVRAELDAHDPDRPSTVGLVGRGRYAVQIEHLLGYFPREQVTVVIMERWSQAPRQLIRQLLASVGLRALRVSARVAHQRKKTVEPVSDDVSDLLREHYRSDREQLRELLGDPIPEWRT